MQGILEETRAQVATEILISSHKISATYKRMPAYQQLFKVVPVHFRSKLYLIFSVGIAKTNKAFEEIWNVKISG